MENASKALIIAGAILLSIIIISLGLVVVNNVRNSIEGQNLNQEELAAFNNQFVSYEGNNITGARVNALIQQVRSSNQAQIDKSGINFVKCTFPTITDGTEATLQVEDDADAANGKVVTVTEGKSARVVPGKLYTVKLVYGAKTSAISEIQITANS